MRFFVLIPAGSKYIPLSALPQLGFCQGSARLYFAKPNTSTKNLIHLQAGGRTGPLLLWSRILCRPRWVTPVRFHEPPCPLRASLENGSAVSSAPHP